MFEQIRAGANALASFGNRVGGWLHRDSGWSIADSKDVGTSMDVPVGGVPVQFGGGIMSMAVESHTISPRSAYNLGGAYIEAGLGIGEMTKLGDAVNQLIHNIPLVNTGSFKLIMSPFHRHSSLQAEDFRFSTWVYVHVSGEITNIAGDAGLMLLMSREQKSSARKLVETVTSGVLGPVATLLLQSAAWTSLFGVSPGVGCGAAASIRVVEEILARPA